MKQNINGLVYEPDTPDMKEARRVKSEKKRIYLKSLGVDFLTFDDETDIGLFNSNAERLQYLKDCMILSTLLDEEKDLPPDLVHRLITIRDRREQLERKKKKK